jgi:hypothetical protein
MALSVRVVVPFRPISFSDYVALWPVMGSPAPAFGAFGAGVGCQRSFPMHRFLRCVLGRLGHRAAACFPKERGGGSLAFAPAASFTGYLRHSKVTVDFRAV